MDTVKSDVMKINEYLAQDSYAYDLLNSLSKFLLFIIRSKTSFLTVTRRTNRNWKIHQS